MPLCGDAKTILNQLNEALIGQNFQQGQADTREWTGAIKAKSQKNEQVSLELAKD